MITYLISLLYGVRVLRDLEIMRNNLILSNRWGGSEGAETDTAFQEVWASRYEFAGSSERSTADRQHAA